MNHPFSRIAFTAVDRPSMERQINAAVESLRIWGLQRRRGILVTRHSHDSFSVELSDAVPVGITCESWAHQAA
ncbi:hypothetical protein [Arthrobacter sp. PM3]|uniref:hypothetical protein n=1 Tax=Arthrobacter sp. PM3 TaxID=2017685 RepID=UPI000E10999E|nr:hypothetical protein [Arthrobacter sp. PM3]AXJ10293.1 hypothetical protein CFN17_12225 [Arthrobacter sp. PM3]